MALEIRSVGTAAQQAAYKATVLPLLRQIRLTQTGAIVLRRIEASPRLVRIVPTTRRELRDGGFNNAVANPMNERSSGTLGVGSPAAGTGSEIQFSIRNLRNRGIQGRNDEVLLHELCHSLRQINGVERYQRGSGGRWEPRAMAGGYGNVEEFFAAMVTSVYSSELGRRPLGNTEDASIRDPSRLNNAPFSTRLRNFQSRMPGFVRELQGISAQQAQFNPFRDVLNP